MRFFNSRTWYSLSKTYLNLATGGNSVTLLNYINIGTVRESLLVRAIAEMLRVVTNRELERGTTESNSDLSSSFDSLRSGPHRHDLFTSSTGDAASNIHFRLGNRDCSRGSSIWLNCPHRQNFLTSSTGDAASNIKLRLSNRDCSRGSNIGLNCAHRQNFLTSSTGDAASNIKFGLSDGSKKRGINLRHLRDECRSACE